MWTDLWTCMVHSLKIEFSNAIFMNGYVCWQPKLAANQTNRSDRSSQAVWPVCDAIADPAGTDRSDRSMKNPSIIRKSYRFRSVNRISYGVSLPHPINIKGHGRLRIQPNRIYQKHIFYLFILFSLPYLFQPRHTVLPSSPWYLKTP